MRYFDFTEWVPILVLIIGLLIIALIIVSDIVNFSNEIDCGTVVDKYIHSHKYRGAMCYLTIEGDKRGRTVQYTFAVTEQEYDKYRIGDFYDRKGQ